MKFQPPRGTRDFLPAEMAARREVFGKFRRVFEGYGYGEVCTPAFEDFSLLSKKSGPDIEKEIYSFRDKGGRKLGLRFDPTVPICRVVASMPSVPKPVKFYYITNMWRYDRPQAGRYREFWQAGAELIGSQRPEADAEIVALAYGCLKAVGLKDFTFKVNSRSIAESLVKKAGIPEGKKFDVFRAMDKLPKAGKAGVRDELRKAGIARSKAEKLFSLLESKEEAGLEGTLSVLRDRGIRNVEVDNSVIRGIDYYTGFVFETFVRGFENLGSVASGGRYDSLLKLYGGGDLPAVGFGLGVERLMEMIGLKGSSRPCAAVLNAGTAFMGKAAEVADGLRSSGIPCETDLMGRSLSKQLDYVNSRGIPWVVFVGEKELSSGKLTLRDMRTGKESRLAPGELAKKLVKSCFK